MIREMNPQNGFRKPYISTYHKNDINLDSKQKFKNRITIIGSTTSNDRRTGIDSKKIASNYGDKPENKNYSRKFTTSTTTNATNVSRKSNDRALNTKFFFLFIHIFFNYIILYFYNFFYIINIFIIFFNFR